MFELSIIVCTYNREKFLPECLNSVALQQLEKNNFELVIVNNNCTDNTDNICKKFLAQHPELNITYVVEMEQGLSHARNRGIQEANAKYLTFIDDDAIAEVDFASNILTLFENYPDAVACGGKVLAKFEGKVPAWRNRFSDSLYFSHYDPGNRLFKYSGNSYPIGCNMTFRSDFFEKHASFNPELGRKGKSGAGFEEKEVFAKIRALNFDYYYDPNQIVQHQIDIFRTQKPYTTKLSRGLGISMKKMYCQQTISYSCAKAFFIIIAKFFAALILAFGYLFLGKPAVSRQLISFRWLVILGFLSGK